MSVLSVCEVVSNAVRAGALVQVEVAAGLSSADDTGQISIETDVLTEGSAWVEVFDGVFF